MFADSGRSTNHQSPLNQQLSISVSTKMSRDFGIGIMAKRLPVLWDLHSPWKTAPEHGWEGISRLWHIER